MFIAHPFLLSSLMEHSFRNSISAYIHSTELKCCSDPFHIHYRWPLCSIGLVRVFIFKPCSSNNLSCFTGSSWTYKNLHVLLVKLLSMHVQCFVFIIKPPKAALTSVHGPHMYRYQSCISCTKTYSLKIDFHRDEKIDDANLLIQKKHDFHLFAMNRFMNNANELYSSYSWTTFSIKVNILNW